MKKRMIAFVLLTALLTSLCVMQSAVADDAQRVVGDVDGSGQLDALDYFMVKAYVLGTYTKATEEQKLAMDVDGDGDVNAFDYLKIKHAVLTDTPIPDPGDPDDPDEPDDPARIATDIAIGCKYTASLTPGTPYPDQGSCELTDGLRAPNGCSYNESRLVGYATGGVKQMTVTVDLGKKTDMVHRFELGYLSTTEAGIGPAKEVEIAVSDDKNNFRSVGKATVPAFEEGTMQTAALELSEAVSCRYVRFTVTKSASWLFFDEVVVIADVEGGSAATEWGKIVRGAYDSDTTTDAMRQVTLKGLSTGTPDRSLFHIDIAKGADYTLSRSTASGYPDEDGLLTNGITGVTHDDGEFVAFSGGKTVDIDVAFGTKLTDICGFEAHSFASRGLGILFPPCITVLVSSDKKNWTEVGRMYAPIPSQELCTYRLELPCTIRAKYVRFSLSAVDCKLVLIDEVSVFAYRTEEEGDSLYPKLKFPTVTENVFWTDDEPDYGTVQNLLRGLPQQIRCFGSAAINDGDNTLVNSGLMTDGRYSTGTNIHNGSFFKFHAGGGREIYFDLTAVSELKAFKASFTLQTDWGVSVPDEVDVVVSMDAVTWYKLGAIKMTYTNDPSLVRCTFTPKTPVAARFVCFSFPTGSWAGVDELEVTGTKKVNSSTKTADKAGLTEFIFNGSENAPGDWAGPSDDVLGGVKDIFLAYHNASILRKEDDLLYEIAYVDKNGKIIDTMFDGVLFLMSGQFPSGSGGGTGGVLRYNKSDAEWLIDTLFTKGQNIMALEDTVGRVKSELKLSSDYKVKYYVSLYYPSSDDFGDIDGDGKSEDLSTMDGKTKVLKWWIKKFEAERAKHSFKNIEFCGYYWYNESMDGDEISMTKAVADYIHSYKSQFFWIPYFSAGGISGWKNFGLDVACLQPNFAFHLDVPYSRVRTAASIAKFYGMCLEIELDPRAASDLRFRLKYYEYLKQGAKMGYMTQATHMYYMSVYIHQYAKSSDPRIRQIYDYTYQFIRGTLNLKPKALSGITLTAKKNTVASGTIMDNSAGTNLFMLYEAPKHGTVTLNDDGTFQYFPNRGYTGKDSFRFCYSEMLDYSDPCTVEITVK